MAKREFETKLLREWEIDYTEDCGHVVDCTHMTSYDASCSAKAIVFRAPDDGRLWQFTYEYNANAGWNNLMEPARIEAVEVEPTTKTVTVYVPVVT